jgi:hypothetical protein
VSGGDDLRAKSVAIGVLRMGRRLRRKKRRESRNGWRQASKSPHSYAYAMSADFWCSDRQASLFLRTDWSRSDRNHVNRLVRNWTTIREFMDSINVSAIVASFMS